ncbi:MAG: NAD(P)-binding domain-containing protein [Streptococcaceae bacterium]|nr:NAD(P)-binding domain-containing protein [Streptococcaceae bacterium]MCH4178028.1 NAD(P)-binding domain-containing protein [Streptococcaceae bacterium]
MKILHIGKKGNLERYTQPSSLLQTIEIVDLPIGLEIKQYLSCASDAEILIADAMAIVPKSLIVEMPELKLIHSEGVGFNFFDLKAAQRQNIPVCNCKSMNAMAVAEQTILLMLCMLRDIRNNDIAVRSGQQIDVKERYMSDGSLQELADCKIGLIGFGDIAKSVAKMLIPFNTKVYYYNRTRQVESVEKTYQVHYLELDQLIKQCQIFSLHLPVTPKTFEIVNSDFINQMGKGSYLVNTSRGELINNAALVEGIRSGQLARVALDTVTNEPVQKNHYLLNQGQVIMDKFIFSPHIAGITASSFTKAYQIIWQNIHNLFEGKNLNNIVN